MTLTDDGLGPTAEQVTLHRRVQALLTRVRYKPGWVFHAQPPATVWDRGQLQVSFAAPDARGRTDLASQVVVHAEVPYPSPTAPDAALVTWLWMTLCQMEEHEAGEWFQIDGTRPFDPHHPTDRPTTAPLIPDWRNQGR